MLKSHITRLIGLTATATLLTVLLATSALAAPKRFHFDAGIAKCFLPDNVYGGTGPTITSPSVRLTNPRRASVNVRAYAIVVNLSTGNWISYQLIADRRIARRSAATFPRTTLSLPDRSTSNFYPVGVHIQFEVRSRGVLRQIGTGIPSAYDIYANGAFGPTYQGRASWC